MRTAAKKGFTLEEAARTATDIGIDWNDVLFTVEQLRKGMDVELEHGKRFPEANVTNDDPQLTGKIAWAHLMERPDYYERLELVEHGDAREEPMREMDPMSDAPEFIRVRGHVYKHIDRKPPKAIRVAGVVYRLVEEDQGVVVHAAKKKGKKDKPWGKLPKGWTKKSAEAFWKTLLTDDGKESMPKHKVTKCVKELKSAKEIDDPGAFCASLADRIEGPDWRKAPRKKKKKSKGKKKKAAIDYPWPEERQPDPYEEKPVYDIPVKFGRSDHQLLADLHRGQGDPLYALVSRTVRGQQTMASWEELEAAVDVLTWFIDESSASDAERTAAEDLRSFLQRHLGGRETEWDG